MVTLNGADIRQVSEANARLADPKTRWQAGQAGGPGELILARRIRGDNRFPLLGRTTRAGLIRRAEASSPGWAIGHAAR